VRSAPRSGQSCPWPEQGVGPGPRFVRLKKLKTGWNSAVRPPLSRGRRFETAAPRPPQDDEHSECHQKLTSCRGAPLGASRSTHRARCSASFPVPGNSFTRSFAGATIGSLDRSPHSESGIKAGNAIRGRNFRPELTNVPTAAVKLCRTHIPNISYQLLPGWRSRRSCPRAWCKSDAGFALSGRAGRCRQAATAGSLTMGSSLNGAIVSSVMYRARRTATRRSARVGWRRPVGRLRPRWGRWRRHRRAA
jgi:hypothetical protein